MPLLKLNDHIKDRQKTQISEYGVAINIKVVSGTTDCPDCTYDSQLRSSSNPNCQTCSGKGKTTSYTDHNEKGAPHWFTVEELTEVPVGGIQAGDCRVMAEYKTLNYWQDAIQNKTILSIDGVNVVVKRVLPSDLKTVIFAYCSRTSLN